MDSVLRIEKFDNGNVSEISTYVNNVRHGVFTTYHHSGVINEITRYVNGVMDGQYLSHYEDGHIRTSMWNHKGVVNGLFCRYEKILVFNEDKIKYETKYELAHKTYYLHGVRFSFSLNRRKCTYFL